MTEERDFLDERREFHDARQRGIGATDSPKILGLSRRGTALSVYEEKVGIVQPGEMSLPAWLGLRMQNVVGELYTQATGNILRADNRQHVHRLHDWLVCHLDFRVAGRPKLLVEAKTRAFMTGFGEDGSQEIPLDIWGQVQHEMAVTDATECHVAVLFGHHTYRTYPIPRNDAYIAKMIPRLESFWNENVVPGVPPEPGGSLDSASVRRAHPDHDDRVISVAPGQMPIVHAALLARHNVKAADEAFAEAENKLIDLIGDAAGVTGPFGTITRKKSRDGVKVDWEQVAATRANVLADLFDWFDGQAARNRLAKKDLARVARAQAVAVTVEPLFTTTKEGTRRMHYAITEENE
jgi:predicted phage-related endonuclease